MSHNDEERFAIRGRLGVSFPSIVAFIDTWLIAGRGVHDYP